MEKILIGLVSNVDAIAEIAVSIPRTREVREDNIAYPVTVYVDIQGPRSFKTHDVGLAWRRRTASHAVQQQWDDDDGPAARSHPAAETVAHRPSRVLRGSVPQNIPRTNARVVVVA